ncbi:MAG: SMC-Scp complex subunit ScpB [Gammaproteobacteria bacterium]|nr:SMC-Scp complex subunit ScpB [Gammaproteobacteria bacterium]
MNGEMNDELKNILEAVLLVSDAPVSIAKLQGLFEDDVQPPVEEIKAAILSLQEDCEKRGVELRKIGNGYRYQNKVKYADWVRKLYSIRPPKLSRALLEILAIIAYRQPVTRGDIEEIRGVSVSADIIQKLQEREWIKQIGVRDLPGRPALFGTTVEFLSYFNLESLKELPSLMQERELGTIARELETPLPPEVLEALEKKSNDDFSALPIDAIVDENAIFDGLVNVDDIDTEEMSAQEREPNVSSESLRGSDSEPQQGSVDDVNLSFMQTANREEMGTKVSSNNDSDPIETIEVGIHDKHPQEQQDQNLEQASSDGSITSRVDRS